MESFSRSRLVRINTLKNTYKGHWQELRSGPPLPPRRCYHSASIHSNSLLIYGGQDFSERVYDDLWEFHLNPLDSSQEHWSELETSGDKPGSLCRHSSIVFNSSLYLFGGNDGVTDNNRVFILDLNTNNWRKVESNIPTLDSYSSVLNHDKWVVFGGYSGGDLTNQVFEFDLISEQWRIVEFTGQTPCPRADHSAVLKDDCMWVYGGKSTDENLRDMWKLNLSGYVWEEVRYEGSDPGTVSGHSALIYGDVMLVFGGYRDILKETNEIRTYDFLNKIGYLFRTKCRCLIR